MKKLLVLIACLCLMLGMVVVADAADLSGCTLTLPSSLKAGESITLVVTGNNAYNVDHLIVKVYKGYEATGTPVYTATSAGTVHTIPGDTLTVDSYSTTYYFSAQLCAADGSTATVGKRGSVSKSYTSEKPSIKLSSTPTTGKPLTISWSPVEHMDRYTVKVSYDSYGYYGATYLAENLTGTSHTIPGTAFPLDLNYTITVTASDSGNTWSSTSAEVDISTEYPPLILNAPSSLPVGSAVNIGWEHAEHSSANLYLKLRGPDGATIIYGDVPVAYAAYSLEEGALRKAGTYSIELYCKTCGSRSKLNTTFTMTGADLPDPTIDVLVAESITLGDTLYVFWTPVPGTTKYSVYINGSTSISSSAYITPGTPVDGYMGCDIPYSLGFPYNKLKVGQNKIKVAVNTGLFNVVSAEYILNVTEPRNIAWGDVPETHPQYRPLPVSWTIYPDAENYRIYLADSLEYAEKMLNLERVASVNEVTSYTIPAKYLTEAKTYYLVIAAYKYSTSSTVLSKAIVPLKVDGPKLEIVDYTPYSGPGSKAVTCTINPYPQATHYSISYPSDLDFECELIPATGKKQTLTTNKVGSLVVKAWCPDGVLQSATFKVATLNIGSEVPDIVVLSVGEKYDMWPHARKMKIYNIINSDIDWRMNTSSSAVELTYKGYIIARRPGTAVIHLDNWFHDSLDVTVYVGTKLKSIKITGPDVLASGKSTTLKASFNPSNATYKNIKWKIVSGSNAATVTSSGKVTAKKVTKPTKVIVAAYTTDISRINSHHVITVMPGATSVDLFDEDGNSLNGKTITIDMNNGIPTGTESILTRQASFKVLPSACVQKVTWKSSDKTIAKVTSTGKIYAVSDGTATITATATDGSGKKATFKVKVVHKPYSLSISGAKTISAGQTVTLKGKVGPSNATSKSVKWKSSNASIAKVDSKGVVTGVSEGTVTITATASGNSKVTDTCTITVLPKATYVDVLDENGSSVRGKTLTIDLHTKQRITLTAALRPENANQAVSWKSSSTKIAKITSAGVVIPVAEGTVTITATAKDGSGKKTTLKVKVVRKPDGLTISGESVLTAGQTLTLTGKISPSNATNKKVKWSSSDESIATVDEAGVVTGVAEGTVTITGKASGNSSVTATHTITVLPKATYVDLLDENGTSLRSQTVILDLKAKQRITLTAAIRPDNANQSVSWKTSDKTIAKVTSAGVVIPVAEGTVTITATAKDGSGKKGTMTIEVLRLATGMTLTGNKKLAVGQSVTLKGKATDATLQKFTWVSDNPAVATVSSSGKVTGVAEGSATITATTKDGTNLSASHTVTVVPAAQSIEILDPDGKVKNGKTIKLSLGKKQKIKLTARILPDEALDNVTWKSSNTKIAKVSSSGTITPVATGKVTITVTAKDGSGVTAKVTIQVNK